MMNYAVVDNNNAAMSMDDGIDNHYGTTTTSTYTNNYNYDYNWLFKFCLVYLGHPILFLGYLFIVGQTKVLGKFDTFTLVSTNVHRINIVLYVAITLPIYVAWLSLQVLLLQRFAQHFSSSKFWESMTWLKSILAAIPGLVNLFAYVTGGMEGNVFGFFFFLPMLLASLAYIGLWISALVNSCSPNNNNSFDGGDGNSNYNYSYDELPMP